MQVSGVVTAILVGALIGIIGRLVVPGRQRIGIILTLLIGIGAALLGTWVTDRFNLDGRAPASLAGVNWDWIELGIQVGFAVIGVAIAAAISHTRISADGAPPRKRRTTR
jgi:uncharacterized membrane protein YeaQ/YmgE (transglycosylase-associated protein family)